MTVVLAAHPQADAYGSDKMLLETMRALRDAGHRTITAFAESGPLLELFAAEGLEFDIVGHPVLRRRFLTPRGVIQLLAGSPAAVLRVARYIRSVRPDVVYVSTMLIPHWLVAARIAGVPTVCHVREGDPRIPPLTSFVIHLPLLLAKRIVANSDATATVITTRVPALTRRTVVVYNGFGTAVTIDSVNPIKGRHVLLAGRLSPVKGQDVGIAALAILWERGIDATLHFAGAVFPGYEWYEQELRAAEQFVGVDAHVVFHGHVRDLSPLYAFCDVVIVPSRSETFGNVAVEAMAVGRPVVASAIGGLIEIVRDGETGFLVPVDDPIALADALETILGDRVLAARFGSAGRARAVERFSADRYASEITDIVAAAAG
jgi:glycosyltransferase involved in cell wall biosynthesis